MNLTNLKNNLIKGANHTGLVLKKYSPEILTGLGIVGFIGTTVLACKATSKARDVIEQYKFNREEIDRAKELAECNNPEIYTKEDEAKDKYIIGVKMCWGMVKTYGPAVSLGLLSTALILAGHGIMKKRNVALIAAYNGLQKTFDDYRRRVVEDYGEEKDQMYKLGIKEETTTVVTTDKDGKKKKETIKSKIEDPNHYSQYARYFDKSSVEFQDTQEYNLMFLKAQQNYFNDMLRIRGHVFLNEVYDALGIPRSTDGAIVGWVLGEGDDFVDFGIFDRDSDEARDVLNGYAGPILLDFNVDGIIYDLI